MEYFFKNEKKEMIKRTLKYVNLLLLSIAILTSFLIFKKRVINTSSISKIYNVLTSYLLIGSKEKEVSSTIKFIHIEKDKYYNNEHNVYSPFNGTIINCDNNSLVIKCDNQFFAYFNSLVNVNVAKYDCITTSDILASFDEYFTFYLSFMNERYSYEEIC
ncbi:MAG: hypothetical protein MR270_05140 [Erysipelotrichaceae bacterium]|nr:hypothetical protein [Erysipelotrichaceae bacterium]